MPLLLRAVVATVGFCHLTATSLFYALSMHLSHGDEDVPLCASLLIVDCRLLPFIVGGGPIYCTP